MASGETNIIPSVIVNNNHDKDGLKNFVKCASFTYPTACTSHSGGRNYREGQSADGTQLSNVNCQTFYYQCQSHRTRLVNGNVNSTDIVDKRFKNSTLTNVDIRNTLSSLSVAINPSETLNNKADVIRADDYNTLRQLLQLEFSERRSFSKWNTTTKNFNVGNIKAEEKKENIILSSDLNMMLSGLNNYVLKTFTQNESILDDSRRAKFNGITYVSTTDVQPISALTIKPDTLLSADVIAETEETTGLNSIISKIDYGQTGQTEKHTCSFLLNALSTMIFDCICYGDCTSYYNCNCYGNCGCHY